MDPEARIDEIISREQYKCTKEEKEALLLPLLVQRIKDNMAFSPALKKYYTRLGKIPDEYTSIADIPPIPVTMFKYFELITCPQEDIVRTLNSSATTTGIPSKIFVNKATAFRQSKGLISILKDFLGSHRRPYLVIDSPNINKAEADTLSARAAAIRGVGTFGHGITYVMDEKNGELFLNVERLKEFQQKNQGKEILVFGFTYIVWSRFLAQMKELGLELSFPQMKLIHSGGWKKLKAQAVKKETFSAEVAKIFNTDPRNIIDFYGMVEQLGVVFLDCPYGYKHSPDFAEVIIKDPLTMKEQPIGVPGLIEIASLIPDSYPGQALITEDVGEYIGIDNCPCGRKGKYFVFRSRVEKTETRGCGDTFAEKIEKQKEGN